MSDTSPHIAILPNTQALDLNAIDDDVTPIPDTELFMDEEPNNRQYMVLDIETGEMYGLAGVSADGRTWVFATQSRNLGPGIMDVSLSRHSSLSGAVNALLLFNLTGKDD